MTLLTSGGLESEAPRRRSLIDKDRRSGDLRSVSLEVIGDFKMFHGTTGIIIQREKYKVYLTTTGEVGGERLYSKVPVVQVYSDSTSEKGGFPRGHGPIGPGYAYSALAHGRFCVDWEISTERWFVEVENTTGTDRDFVVTVSGV